jgi:NAD(P)-dependent dehydrogenase (short-subunit alcohol dehydrogenase family)
VSQQVAVITGAGGGIGQATVGLFQNEGWYVIGLDRVGLTGVDRGIQADLASGEEIESAFRQLSDVGHIDALVNNAAAQLPGDVLSVTPDDWDTTMATNVRAAYLTTRLVHPHMRDGGGSIVNIASVHALATSGGVAAYATSKGALLALTRASALDLATDGIRVNAVLPGAVDTPMLLSGHDDASRGAAIARLTERTPLGRIGRPEEIAQAILFLADHSRSAFITGQTLVVDGGALAALHTE